MFLTHPTRRLIRLTLGLLLCAIVRPSVADELSFNRDVRPILSDACFSCHGPDAGHREADLRLDVESAAKESAIVAGDVEASPLIERITTDDADLQMPPLDSGKQLEPAQVEILRRWVEQGATYERYWAYVEPRAHAPPSTSRSDWSYDPIDDFIAHGVEEAGLDLAADADPITLIRRLSFDLTGLPPAQAMVDRYLANPTSAEYDAIVDELLASPAFGERMAIYWLDLVRYADTVGYHGDQDHSASPYRDYVIDAFNRNLPFDQFTREQLAGDLLPQATTEQLVASCYNRLLQTSHEGGVQPKEYLAIYAADRVRNVSAVWMGATVGCAQCHDHKYDPYTMRDFYSLAAFFADLDESQHFKVGTNSLPTKRPPEITYVAGSSNAQLRAYNEQIAAWEAREREPKQEERYQELKRLRDQLLKTQGRTVMVSKSIEPRVTRILPRGNWLDESGPVVSPAVPEFLKSIASGKQRATRLDLANWLVDPVEGAGGLTARVTVNRWWYLMFGRGLSASLDDFGGQGTPPSHPELLDQLAVDFIAGGWNVKSLLRRLVRTRSYRQASIAPEEALARDFDNVSFARQSRFRMPAEMVRDNALAISGLLVQQVGGPSVKPYQPSGYYRHLNFPTRVYVPHRDDRQWRRGVYVHWQRQFLHPMLKAMDAPSREECTARRPRSNTPLEALVLLNDPTMIESAVSLANRLLVDPQATDEQRLERAFRLATSRSPDEIEMAALNDLLQAETAYYTSAVSEAKRLVESVDRRGASAEDDPVRLASWTGVCRAVLNTYETVTRN